MMYIYIMFLCMYSIWALNIGQYPYKWLWDYAGDKLLKPKAETIFTGVCPRLITTLWPIFNPLLGSDHRFDPHVLNPKSILYLS